MMAVGLGSGADAAVQPSIPPGSSTGAATQAAAPLSAFTAVGRPRIGLVLGGGGAKGFAHIGVIEELERRHIPIDVIAGTSMGAVVGSMYATGNDANAINAIAHGIDWQTIFSDELKRSDLSFRRKREVRDILLDFRLRVEDGRPVLPTGVLGSHRLFGTVQQLLAPWRATEDFDDLPIPFRAVAADITNGKPVVMDDGDLSTAVFASMSIPAAFPPVERQGYLLVDGGIADNLPVDVARRMGVDVVIVVDVGEPPAQANRLKSALSVINQMQLLLGYDAIRRQRESLSGRDVLIEPDITGISVASFDQLDLGIERGRVAAAKMAEKLSDLAVDDTQWAQYLAERQARSHPKPIRIDRLKIVNGSNKVPTATIDTLVTTRPGDILIGDTMKRDVDRIFALDAFNRVDYRIDLAPQGNTLVVNAEGVRGASKYWQTGLLLASNFGKQATFDLALAFTDRNFLDTGAEWRGFARVGNDVRLDVSLFKPFGQYFVEPTAAYERYSRVVTGAGPGGTIDAFQVSRLGAGADAGKVFGNWGELRAGFRIGGVNPSVASDEKASLSGWYTDTDWRVGFTVDTLDSLIFPRQGWFTQIQYIDHFTALGGKFTRNNLIVNVQKPISVGRATVLLGGRLGLTTDISQDYFGDFQLGGFLNLSGYTRGALVGQQLMFGRAVGYYRITDKSPILDLPIYVGGSFEAGNVWDQRSEISLGSLRTAASAFIAADTPIGPMMFGYGRSDSLGSIYLSIGRLF